MLKILQARLHQYVNRELPDVQAGFGKGRGTRDQIANIHCSVSIAKFLDCTKFNVCFFIFPEMPAQKEVFINRVFY